LDEDEADIAEARAEGDRASKSKAKHALASRYSLEKKLVKLSTRKGKKITSTIWQFGYFQQVSLVDDWQHRGRELSKLFAFDIFIMLKTMTHFVVDCCILHRIEKVSWFKED
jgi:hypothetical protein